jgi:hypothetical protein
MEITTGNKSESKSKSGVGKSGRKRMNKKEASKWFQGLTRLERSLLKQEKNSSSSSDEKKKPKKEMHARERELLLKRRSEHEARMKAQLQSKVEITKQIQKCKDMRSQLIPFQMRLEQMKLHESHAYHDYTQSSYFQFKLVGLECGISNQIRLIQNEEKVLFDMQHKHHFIKKSITEIIEKRKTSSFSKLYTRVQTKNYVDDVLRTTSTKW